MIKIRKNLKLKNLFIKTLFEVPVKESWKISMLNAKNNIAFKALQRYEVRSSSKENVALLAHRCNGEVW